MVTRRRYRYYAGETGTSYQYFYAGKRPVRRPGGLGQGSDFIFVVRGDQNSPFVLRIFLAESALSAWRREHSRELDSNELYALAKMRLFRAFDEVELLARERLNIVVDEQNLEDLLAPLGVC